MIDYQVDRDLRIDTLRIVAGGITHCSQIDYRRHSGKVLHQDTGRPKRYFTLRTALLHPIAESTHIARGIFIALIKAQNVFQQNL